MISGNISSLELYYLGINVEIGIDDSLLSHSVVSDCDPMDCSPPGSSVNGILQARILDQIRSDQSLSRVQLFATP